MINIFKLSFLELKKQKISFLIFTIFSCIFFTITILSFNYTISIENIGIKPFVNNNITVLVEDYKDINYDFSMFSPYADNKKYLVDSLKINDIEESNFIIDYNLKNDEYLISINGYSIGETILINFNNKQIFVKVIDNTNDIKLSNKFLDISSNNYLTLQINKDNSNSYLDLYNKHNSNLSKTSIDNYILYINIIKSICIVISISMIILLILSINNYLNILITNNKKTISLYQAFGMSKTNTFLIYYLIIFLVLISSFIIASVISFISVKIINLNSEYFVYYKFIYLIFIFILSFIFELLYLLIKQRSFSSSSISDLLKEGE